MILTREDFSVSWEIAPKGTMTMISLKSLGFRRSPIILETHFPTLGTHLLGCVQPELTEARECWPTYPAASCWESMAVYRCPHSCIFFKTTLLSAASDCKFNASTCCPLAQLIHSDPPELKEISEKPLFFSNKLPVSTLA